MPTHSLTSRSEDRKVHGVLAFPGDLPGHILYVGFFPCQYLQGVLAQAFPLGSLKSHLVQWKNP